MKINGRDAAGYLLSLLLAFSIWLMHNLSQNYTEDLHIYITAEADLSGHSRRSVSPVPVAVRCRTRGFDLIRLNRNNSRRPAVIVFDAADLHPMEGDGFFVTGSDLNRYMNPILGSNATNATILMDRIVFRFAPESCRKVPVQPLYSLTCRPQHTCVGELALSPDSVYLYGDLLHLEKLDRVVTESFQLADLSSDARGTVRIEPIKGIRMSAQQTEYSVAVERYVEVMAELPVTAVNVPAGRNLIICPSVAKVRFRCGFPLTVKPEETVRFQIDFRDFEHSLNGRCIARPQSLPAGVYGYTLTPEVFDCVEKVRR